MAANKTENDKPVVWRSSKLTYALVIIPVLIFGMIALSWFGASDSSSSGGTATTAASPEKSASKKESQIIRVEVDPEEWSEEVSVPVGYRWCIDRPGCWGQCWFWSEEKPRPRVEAGKSQWFGKIPETSFRLRGTKGTVEIVIEPK